MLSVEELTHVPGEQKIIEELDEGLSQFYRPDLPHHNYPHAHDDVLREVLRLDGLQPASLSHGRFDLIAAALGQDAGSHLPLDSERNESREERTTRLIRPVLVEVGFRPADIEEIDGMVLSTQVGKLCVTPNQIKLRRGDIANVRGRRLPFIATTVNLFSEKKILAKESGDEPPAWTPYIDVQQRILMSLLSQNLLLGDERLIRGVAPFNRDAMRNVSWLSKKMIRDPSLFHSKYDQYLRPLVSANALAAIA